MVLDMKINMGIEKKYLYILNFVPAFMGVFWLLRVGRGGGLEMGFQSGGTKCILKYDIYIKTEDWVSWFCIV